MPNCKTCDKKFHACTSCGLERMWMYDYCSGECWRISKEYTLNKADFKAWWESLDPTQRGLFKVMFDKFLWDGDYDSEIEDWIKEE